MTNESKNRIICQNVDNTVNKIKELSEKYEMSVEDVETIFENIIKVISSNEKIEIDYFEDIKISFFDRLKLKI